MPSTVDCSSLLPLWDRAALLPALDSVFILRGKAHRSASAARNRLLRKQRQKAAAVHTKSG
jgi:hypothetical protein